MAFKYVGNPDFRGWLTAKGQGGGQKAGSINTILNFVGNDGKIDTREAREYGDNPKGFQNLASNLYTQFKQEKAASQANTGGYSGGGSGGANDAEAKANEAAYWGDQVTALQRLLGSTNKQKGQGLTRIQDSYQESTGRVKQQKKQGLRDYDTKRTDTLKDKMGTFGDIDTKARTAYESLQRLFQLGNSSVSSAARQVAPTAVSRNATQQRTRENSRYGRNLRDIDTAEDDFKVQVAQALEDLLSEKKSTTEDFLRGILTQKASLNQQISDAVTQRSIAQGGSYQSAAAQRAPFQGRISNIQNNLDSLFNRYRAPRFTPRQIEAKAPDLSQYLVDPISVGAQQANPGIDQSLLPYLSGIRGAEDENTQGLPVNPFARDGQDQFAGF